MLSEDAEEDCRKDLGEVQRLHRRSRGVECVVGVWGVIEYWAPLYKSEGPTQVALIFLNYLRLKLHGKTLEDFRKFFFSFDNICHVDELRLLKKPLALPSPEDRLWMEINKVIGPERVRKKQENSSIYFLLNWPQERLGQIYFTNQHLISRPRESQRLLYKHLLFSRSL